MRWLFYTLLLANGLLGLWVFLEQRGAAVVTPGAKGRLPAIPLLAEVAPHLSTSHIPAPPTASPPQASATPGASAPKPVSPEPSASPSALPVGAAVIERKAVPAEPVHSPTEGAVATAPDTSAQLGADAPTDSAEVRGAGEAKPAPIPSAESCWRLGPAAVADSAGLELRLRGQGWLTRREERRREEGFIVYWPPLPERALALAKARELRARGVDSFAIGEGALLNGLSLGLFSRRENAERHAAELARKGVTARVAPRQLEPSEVDFLVTLPAGAELAKAGLPASLPSVKIACR